MVALSTRTVGRWTLRFALLWCSTSGCDSSAKLLGSTDEPIVYLVLSADPLGPDSALYAVAAAGTKSAQMVYGTVDAIAMTRRSDGAIYDWRVDSHSGPVPRGTLSGVANLRLPWTGAGHKLGRSQLTKGDTYDLSMTVNGRQVEGSAYLPAGISVSVEGTGPGAQATWTATSPGVVYLVEVSVDDPTQFATYSRSYTIKANAPREVWNDTRITVTALDPDYLNFQVDTLRAAFGLSGARGAFVAIAQSSAALDMGGLREKDAADRSTNPLSHQPTSDGYQLHKAFSPPETVQHVAMQCSAAGWGCIECKKVLHALMETELVPIRSRAK